VVTPLSELAALAASVTPAGDAFVLADPFFRIVTTNAQGHRLWTSSKSYRFGEIRAMASSHDNQRIACQTEQRVFYVARDSEEPIWLWKAEAGVGPLSGQASQSIGWSLDSGQVVFSVDNTIKI